MGNWLDGKVAVVTGSGRGIGREIVLLMASQGAKIVVNDLGGTVDGKGSANSVADQTVAEIKERGGKAVSNYDSVATSEGADRIIGTAIDNFGKIDILVNNAGIARDRMVWNMTDEEWDAVIKVHLYGTFNCTRAAVRQMRESIPSGRQANGRIINVTSHAGIRGNPGQPNYGAAKMGIVGFTFSTAMACERLGITCNAIAPRAITRITDTMPEARMRELMKSRGTPGWDAPDVEDVKKAFLGGPPASIAPLVTWLGSDEAQHVNGQVLMITEGAVALFSKMEEYKTAYRDGIFSVDELSRAMRSLVPAQG